MSSDFFFVSLVIKYYFYQTIFCYLCTKPVAFLFNQDKKSLKKKGRFQDICKKITDISENEENLKLKAFLQELTEWIRISNYLAAS